MKKSLPNLAALAAFILATAAQADPNVAVPPRETTNAQLASGEGRGESGLPAPLQPVTNADPDPTPIGNRVLLQTISQLERHTSVSAKLRHQIAIGKQQLYGVGSYWQQGSGEELKVRLELQIAGEDAQLLQVCNSRFRWLDRKLPTGRTITRVDLRQLRADPSLGANLSEIKPGEASWSLMQAELTAYTGGMPTLLTALSENFDFMPPQAMRLAMAPPLTSEPMTVPVFAVVGHWKPEKIAALLAKTQVADVAPSATPNQPSQPPPTHTDKPSKHKPLPERLPEEVLLLVGQADMFPYRIEYRRLETPDTLSDGTPIPYQLSTHPMVVLEFSDVIFDAPIAPGQFDYAPGDADWSDLTIDILSRLRQQHQAQVATRPMAGTH